jgi:hypothetical protein
MVINFVDASKNLYRHGEAAVLELRVERHGSANPAPLINKGIARMTGPIAAVC